MVPRTQVQLAYQLIRIRLFEERALEEFSGGTLSGTTHTCIGQEADAAGVTEPWSGRISFFQTIAELLGLPERGNCGDTVTEHPTEPEPIHPALLCRTGQLLQIQSRNRRRQAPKLHEIRFVWR